MSISAQWPEATEGPLQPREGAHLGTFLEILSCWSSPGPALWPFEWLEEGSSCASSKEHWDAPDSSFLDWSFSACSRTVPLQLI